jgi:hypothetical protein
MLMPPPEARTFEKLLRDLDEVLDRDRQFIVESAWLLLKWRWMNHARSKRIHEVWQDKTRPDARSR